MNEEEQYLGETPYVPPTQGESAFNCPSCGAYAKQSWHSGGYRGRTGSFVSIYQLQLGRCSHCNEDSLWLDGRLLSPEMSVVGPPNRDLDDDIKDDYREAASIVERSPRGAAALLRLCIQKLCQQLGEPGKKLNADIANLVKKGLSPTTQRALDIVRVIGNEAVHPGQMNIKDDKDDTKTAHQLFALVNLIAREMITLPREIEELYEELPESKREAIEKRNSSETEQT